MKWQQYIEHERLWLKEVIMKAKKDAMKEYYESLCRDGLAEIELYSEEDSEKYPTLYEDELPDDVFMKECLDGENTTFEYYKYNLAENITRNTLFSMAKKINGITLMLAVVLVALLIVAIMCIVIISNIN